METLAFAGSAMKSTKVRPVRFPEEFLPLSPAVRREPEVPLATLAAPPLNLPEE